MDGGATKYYTSTSGQSVPTLGNRFTLMHNFRISSSDQIRQQFIPQTVNAYVSSFTDLPNLLLTIDNVQYADDGTYFLGCHYSDSDNACPDEGGFVIRVLEPIRRLTNIHNLANSIYQEMGQDVGQNVWLEWVQYTSMSATNEDCVACAAARPRLTVVPTPYLNDTDQACMLRLFVQDTFVAQDTCYGLHRAFPVANSKEVPTQWNIDYGGFICYSSNLPTPRSQGTFRSKHTIDQSSFLDPTRASTSFTDHNSFPSGFCDSVITSTSDDFPLLRMQHVSRADVWWLCSDFKLYPYLADTWTGQCTPVMITMPFTIVPASAILNDDPATASQIFKKTPRLNRRSTNSFSSFDNDKIYISSIGTPVGVPKEFMAQNEIAAGFSSIIPQIQINKNVVWLNYIFFNTQRFINYTIDALEGVHAQLDKTSIMTLQNRIALDMLLAKEGGVCKLFDDGTCCTFIPMNTSPNGSFTKALDKLKSLRQEITENAGTQSDNFILAWFRSIFGSWSSYAFSIFSTIILIIVTLLLLTCCVIPCVRGFISRGMSSAMNRQFSQRVYIVNTQESTTPLRTQCACQCHCHDTHDFDFE